MIFYLTNGSALCGTQAEARDLDKHFVQVDVPTDKAGLMAYINELYARTVEPSEPPVFMPPPAPAYTIKTLEIDKVFQNLPLAHQLSLASLALEKARDNINA